PFVVLSIFLTVTCAPDDGEGSVTEKPPDVASARMLSFAAAVVVPVTDRTLFAPPAGPAGPVGPCGPIGPVTPGAPAGPGGPGGPWGIVIMSPVPPPPRGTNAPYGS